MSTVQLAETVAAPTPRPLPTLTGSVTPVTLADAFPGSPFGDQGWRVHTDDLRPAITRKHCVITDSAAQPAPNDEVVVVGTDGITTHGVMGPAAPDKIVLKRWKLDARRQHYVLVHHKTIPARRVREVLMVRSRCLARIVLPTGRKA
jgi:hypothetical protein